MASLEQLTNNSLLLSIFQEYCSLLYLLAPSDSSTHHTLQSPSETLFFRPEMMDRLSPHPPCGGLLMTYRQLSPKFLFHIAQQPGTTFCRLAITRAVLDNLLPQLVHGALAADLKRDYVSILPLAPSCADSQVLLLTRGLGQRQQLIAHCVPLHLPHDCQTHCAKSFLKNFLCYLPTKNSLLLFVHL